MTKFSIALVLGGLLAAPAFAGGHASGDAAAGEAVFNQCQTCHVVTDADGNTLAGRNARTGPNLYGVAGRAAGSEEDFRYSSALADANAAGIVWDEESFVAFVQDPTGYLREALDDSRARSKMSYRVRSEEDAINVYAYLASLAPES
jgi:cytochrome c